MPTTIAIMAPELSGETGLTLHLKTTAGVTVNTGGDTLTEDPASSGRFTASVAETLSALYHCGVNDADGIVREGWLPNGETLIQDSYPSAASGGGDAEQATSESILTAVTAHTTTLANISAKTTLITSGRIYVLSRVAGTTINAKIGDDHLVAASNALTLEVDDQDCALYQFLTTEAHTSVTFGAGRGRSRDEIEGTVAVASITHVGTVTYIPIEITSAETINLQPDTYSYDIQVITAAGYKVTKPGLEGTLQLVADRHE